MKKNFVKQNIYDRFLSMRLAKSVIFCYNAVTKTVFSNRRFIGV